MKRIIMLCGVVAALGGCGDAKDWNNVPICTPKKVASCVCDTGAAGQHRCDDDGLGYGTCACVDAGVGSGSDGSGSDGNGSDGSGSAR